MSLSKGRLQVCTRSHQALLIAASFNKLLTPMVAAISFYSQFWNSAMLSGDNGSFLAGEDYWEGWWSIFACLLVAVETNSCLPHFGQLKVWDEDGRDTARSFFLRSSFAALCLSASNSHLAFLTDECQLSRSESSCCHVWWLFPACASCLFSWSF